MAPPLPDADCLLIVPPLAHLTWPALGVHQLQACARADRPPVPSSPKFRIDRPARDGLPLRSGHEGWPVTRGGAARAGLAGGGDISGRPG